MTELFPLSMSQYTLIVGLLSNSDLRNNGRLNTLTCCFEWKEGSIGLLEKIANQLLEKNDAFRLRPVYHFPWSLKQYIKPYEPEYFPVLKFDTEDAYEAWLTKAKDNDVRLLKDKLYDFIILERADGGYTLWIQMNHFLTDGYSMKLMANQIRALDKRFTKGEPVIMPDPGSYRDHVMKERAYRKSSQFKVDRAYWRKVFRYHKDFSFPAGSRSMKIQCEAQRITVDGKLYRKLVSFCRDNGISVSSVLMSGAAMTAHVITGATYFSMASLSYGRHDGVQRRTMGAMMNSPVMMYSVDNKKTFTDFCHDNYDENLEMLRHLRFSSLDFTPLSYLLCMSHGVNFNHSWILFSQMDYESYFVDGDPKGRMFWSNTNVSQFYAAVFDVPKEERITLELRYHTKRFDADTISKLLSAYHNVLTVLIHKSHEPMKDVLK